EDDSEVFVVLLFEFVQAAGEVLDWRSLLAVPYECPNHGDGDFDDPVAVHYARQHCNAVLSEGVRARLATVAPPVPRGRRLRRQRQSLRVRQRERKIAREAIRMSADLFIQAFG